TAWPDARQVAWRQHDGRAGSHGLALNFALRAWSRKATKCRLHRSTRWRMMNLARRVWAGRIEGRSQSHRASTLGSNRVGHSSLQEISMSKMPIAGAVFALSLGANVSTAQAAAVPGANMNAALSGVALTQEAAVVVKRGPAAGVVRPRVVAPRVGVAPPPTPLVRPLPP